MEAIICAVISAVTTLIVSVGSFQVSVRKDREKAKEELKEELGDLGSIPGLGRSPGEGNGNPLQYSGLENSMDYIVHGVAKR